MKLNVLSLFDGMSCGRIALERAGIEVENYYASEIDKYAIKVSETNYTDIIRLGDVTKVRIDKGRNIDLLIAGSPCQGFSFAGRQLNFEDPRSKLFFDFVRILKECRRYNPDVLFLLENVKMKQEYQDIISAYLCVKPIAINSSLVSAQNRQRLYWTNIPNVNQPEDKGIILKDILEEIPFTKVAEKINVNPSGKGMNGKIHTGEKSPCLTTNKGEGSKIGIIQVAKVPNCNRRDRSVVVSQLGKSTCLDTCGGGGREPKIISEENDKDVFLYRKLTPIECERLQTVPDKFTDSVSNSQRYKMLGNGWTVDVIAHIFSFIKQQ